MTQGVILNWQKIVDHAPWSPRDSTGNVVFAGKMWLLGGYQPQRMNQVWSSAEGRQWEQVTAAAPWKPRNLPAALVHNGRMWVMGGFAGNPSREMYNDVWNSTDGADWTCVTPSAAWAPRASMGAATFRGRMWVTGGNLHDLAPAHDVWSSADGRQWEQGPTPPWTQRGMHALVEFRNRLWLLGGGHYDESKPLNVAADYNDIWVTDDGHRWECVVKAAPWSPRRFHKVVEFDNRLWLIAGFASGNQHDTWVSDDALHWERAEEHAPWPIRHEQATLVHNGVLWVLGGYGNILYNDIWTLPRQSGR